MGSLLQPGDEAPPFEAPDQEGNVHRLEDYGGQALVLYFYPWDNTPGCTTEACNFRDRMPDYRDHGVAVLGVSTQGEEKHRSFAEEHDLNFPLLVDEGKEISKAYGAHGIWKIIPLNKRVTYLVDGEGTVREVWEDVDPSTHADEVLQRVRDLGLAADAAEA
jgi:peroxiredoxin Q/BCP